ncbi:hypothetical protein Tco_1420975 [Tanacetum coccineum]
MHTVNLEIRVTIGLVTVTGLNAVSGGYILRLNKLVPLSTIKASYPYSRKKMSFALLSEPYRVHGTLLGKILWLPSVALWSIGYVETPSWGCHENNLLFFLGNGLVLPSWLFFREWTVLFGTVGNTSQKQVLYLGFSEKVEGPLLVFTHALWLSLAWRALKVSNGNCLSISSLSSNNTGMRTGSRLSQQQGKDDTIRNLDAQINIMKVLNVGSTEGSCDQQALDTDRIQLKDMITSLRIQLDGLKVENVSLKRRYDELSKANTHSRTAYTEKINALTAENAKLKTELSGKKSGGSTASEKPKVLASGMYTKSSKYIPPPKRANWVKPTPLPKKKQVTFQEPPRTSNRPTQKPPVQQNKKPNVPVNLSTRTKPATESRKPMPKSHTQNYRILPSKCVNARRAADHNRKLNVIDHNQFVIRSLKSVNTKTPQAKHSVNHTKKVWKATRNHNVNTTKTAWRPTGKVVGSVKPQWKPTGRHFALYDNCPLTRIMEPIVEPLELTPSVSSSSKVTMISRFTDCKLSDRKAGSKGISGIFEC